MSEEGQAGQGNTNTAGTSADASPGEGAAASAAAAAATQETPHQETHSAGQGTAEERAERVKWMDGLSEENRGNDFLKGFKGDLNDFVKQSLETRGKVPVVPSAADGYIYELDKESGLTPEHMKPFLDFAHSIGMTNSQVQAFAKREADAIKAKKARVAETSKEAATKTAEKLKTLWGNEYDSRAKRVADLFDHYAEAAELGDEFHQLIVSKGLLNNELVARFLDAIGADFREGHFTGGGRGPQKKGRKRTPDGRPILNFEPPDKK